MAQLGEEELTLSREQAFPFFLAGGLNLTGAALVAQGETEAGLERMREGARLYRAAGVEVGLVHLSHLAQVLLDADHVEEALAVVADALARSPASGERVYWAELYRIKGEALLRQDAPGCGGGLLPRRDRARPRAGRAGVRVARGDQPGPPRAPRTRRPATRWPRAARGSPRAWSWRTCRRPRPCSARQRFHRLRRPRADGRRREPQHPLGVRVAEHARRIVALADQPELLQAPRVEFLHGRVRRGKCLPQCGRAP